MSMLNAKRLIDNACDAADNDDFGDDDRWREGLERLLNALNAEAALNDLGATMGEGEMPGYLTPPLGVVAHRRAHPEIADPPVVPPIVIIGQGRTGTTIL